ncbi:MAG: helix-hairpin-helix domain-containing protein [Fimbriimonadaceae bacterium]|nr:helix-hairpin-helix domain-containing protein [Fimbriimonadaceae bacterium]
MTVLQKIGSVVAAGLALAGAGYVGSRYLREPGKVEFQRIGRPGEATEVAVHVTGQVKSPGLVTLSPEARVADAIERAGGLTDQAAPDRLNLAAKVKDGSKLYVPAQGEAFADEAGVNADPAAQGNDAVVGLIPLNQASQSDLESIPGIGPSLARRILDYRATSGGFKSIEELEAVKGIGPKTLVRIRPYVKL